MKNKKSLLDTLRLLAEGQQKLALQALDAYEPLVTATIKNNNINQHEIEHLLDGMLDFCYDDAILVLYRKLCRYYFDINPAATVDYIDLYRERWDEDGKMNFKKTLP